VREKDQLLEFADAIRTKLRFFDEFETVYAQFQKVGVTDVSYQHALLCSTLGCMCWVVTRAQHSTQQRPLHQQLLVVGH
jgi:hypothetical protein